MVNTKPIYVTEPYLPPLEEFIPYLEKIWASKMLTNGGPFHQQLESALTEYLGVPYISLFTNGTIALITALQALGISGEVITTPYSFVATSHALLWHGLKPVFADIEPGSLNIDPEKIRNAITPFTSAIMPVHCYGHPCNVAEIKKIAEENNLRIIYDAAHAFGVKDQFGSILRHGDLSVLSFHATKVFNTFEGGAIVCSDLKMKQRIDQLKNFGFINEISVATMGINGKMSEINSAMGLLQLKYVDDTISKRKSVDEAYRLCLKNVNGIDCLQGEGATEQNYSYFPVLVTANYHLTRDGLYEKLKANNIFPRRYFYPLISDFSMYKEFPSADSKNLSTASDVSSKILCLPISPTLTLYEVEQICAIILEGSN